MSTTTPDPGEEADTESDPALDDGGASDWVSEGGATENGPATHVDADET